MPHSIAEVQVRLEALQVGQDVLEAPAWIAQRGPFVVIGGRSAYSEPRQPRRAAKELHTPQRLRGAARVRLGRIAPVDGTREMPADSQCVWGVVVQIGTC